MAAKRRRPTRGRPPKKPSDKIGVRHMVNYTPAEAETVAEAAAQDEDQPSPARWVGRTALRIAQEITEKKKAR